jgi:2-polyprenyl-3-methyl-5-hydroxy-6-metoxy-1,4-benzoquinol methylase
MLVRVVTPTTDLTPCIACGGTLDGRDHPLRHGSPITGGHVLRCKACGTLQVAPRPTSEALAKLYGADYYESFIAGPGLIGGHTEVSSVLRSRLVELDKQVGKGRLLDVGCGIGIFVKHAVEQGWDAAGLETSAWAAREGSLRNHVVIHHAELADAPIAPRSLDVVHFNHVMEHVIDPVSTMATALKLLRPGGILVVEVPQEIRYPLSDRVFRTLHPDLYRTEPPALTHHITFFTVGGLRSAASRAGFAVERTGTVRHLRTDESRLPIGVPAKRLLYWTEAALKTAPDIELWASRPPDREPSQP